MTRTISTIVVVGLATIALLGVTGCGAEAAPPGDPIPSASATGGATPEPTAAPTSEPVAAGESSTALPAGEPFTTVRGDLGSDPVIAAIYPIQRGEQTATASVHFSLVSPRTTGFRVFRSLNDRNPELADKGPTAPDGLRLIDSNAKKAYLPATIGDRECLCSPRTNGFNDRHSQLTVSVTFAAPPASAQSIDLLIPGFGTVSDVPIQ